MQGVRAVPALARDSLALDLRLLAPAQPSDENVEGVQTTLRRVPVEKGTGEHSDGLPGVSETTQPRV